MRSLLCWSLLFTAAVPLAAASSDDPTPEQQRQIIERFAAKEAEFAKARESYTYRQTYKMETLDEALRPDGRMERVFDVFFDERGKRGERVVYAPVDTLQRISLDPEDEQDMHSTQQFVLTTKDLPFYDLHYIGRQNVDEIGCYVFAVRPKQMATGTRYFAGVIWVDDRDLQIVKSYGRGVSAKNNSRHRYPKFETYREQIDGKFWFPTYTIANDTLDFRDDRNPDFNDRVRIRMVVTFKDYKQFKASSTITFEDTEEPKKEEPKPDKKQ